MQLGSRRSRRGTALVVAVGMAVSVTGTGAALAAPSAAPGAKARRTTRKAVPVGTNKGTIRIGLLGSERGSRGQAIPPETKQIADAWANLQNRAGGINGYRFRVLYRNVDGQGRKAVQAV